VAVLLGPEDQEEVVVFGRANPLAQAFQDTVLIGELGQLGAAHHDGGLIQAGDDPHPAAQFVQEGRVRLRGMPGDSGHALDLDCVDLATLLEGPLREAQVRIREHIADIEAAHLDADGL